MNNIIKRNTWVEIQKVILEPAERAPQVPDDTKKTPLKMWVKGYLQEDGNLFDTVRVKTLTGRIESGTLIKDNPNYSHSFGDFVPEILEIGKIVRRDMEGDYHE